MQTFSTEIDISEFIQSLEKSVRKLSDAETFYYMILGFKLYSYDQAMEMMIDEESGFLSKHLFTEQLLGKNGELKSILPSWDDALTTKDKKKLLPHAERFCVERYSLRIDLELKIIMDMVQKRQSDFSIEIMKIVDSSYFIPQSRKKAFLKALILGYEGDYISSISILGTQIEGAIRALALSCGDSVLKINTDKTEEYLSLDALLQSPKLNECINEDLLFNIKLIFSSPYGYNIRNEIAHGVLEDDDFNTKIGFFTWWFILRLCVEFSGLKLEYSKAISSKLKLI